MDLPYVKSDNISPCDSVTDYEKSWKSKRIRFSLMTRCMTAMIERLMPKIEIAEIKKIVIECVENNPRERIINLEGICFIQILFNIDDFFGMDDYTKKQYVIAKILEAVKLLEIKKNYDLSEIKKACGIIMKKNYVNEWFWKKSTKHKNKVAQVKIKHDIEEVRIYIVISSKGSITQEEFLVACEKPDEWFYNRLLGKIMWVSDEQIQLIAKDGEIHSVYYHNS